MRHSAEKPAQVAEQLFQTAITLHQDGALQRAEHLYREVLRQFPQHAGALNMLGVIGCQTGNFKQGADLIRQAIEHDPDNPDYHNNLGMASMQNGDPAGAIPSFEQAVTLKPRFAEAQFNLGNALMATGEDAAAEKHYRKAIRSRPDYVDALNNLGNLLRQRGKVNEAGQLFRKVVKLAPDFAGGYFNLALAVQAQANYEEAIEAFRRALELDDRPAHMWEALGHCLRQQGALDDAEAAFDEALKRQPESTALLNALGLVQFAKNRVDDALASFEAALALDAALPLSQNHTGMACSALGDRSRAASHFERAIAIDAGFGDAYRNLAELNLDEAQARDLIGRISRQLANDTLAPLHRIDMQFALGKLLDDLGQFEEAFAAFETANQLKHVDVRFNAEAQGRYMDAIIEVFNAEYFEAAASHGESSEQPVFVVGMPRSGTSLVEQIAASHPRVFGAGELTFFPEHIMTLARRLESDKSFPYCVKGKMEAIAQLAPAYLELLEQRADGAVRVTDKMPYNFLYLGVIAALFPRARVVHCRRDPMATCFSIYTRKLAGSHPYSYDLQELGAAYRAYERLMGHWRTVLPMPLLDLDYEGLIADQEGCTRELIAFLGLDWDPACLDFHRTKRAVTTASQWQVRRPLYASAAEHWRHYADHLEPLREVLLGAGAV